MITLPENIHNSKILQQQHLQLLSSVPEPPVVDPSFDDDRLQNIFQYFSLTPNEMDVEIHKYAAELLTENKVYEAWQVLLSSEIV